MLPQATIVPAETVRGFLTAQGITLEAAPAQAADRAAIEKLIVEPSPKSQNRSRVSEEAIRNCAYHKWEALGKPDGDGVHFWIEAEKELCQSN